MGRHLAGVALGLLGLAACGAPPDETPAAAPAPDATAVSRNSPIAGTTLSCHTGGQPSLVTFGADGRLTGRLLGTDVGGTWRAGEGGMVRAHVVAGSVSLRDELGRRGNRWSGQTLNCVAR